MEIIELIFHLKLTCLEVETRKPLQSLFLNLTFTKAPGNTDDSNFTGTL